VEQHWKFCRNCGSKNIPEPVTIPKIENFSITNADSKKKELVLEGKKNYLMSGVVVSLVVLIGASAMFISQSKMKSPTMPPNDIKEHSTVSSKIHNNNTLMKSNSATQNPSLKKKKVGSEVAIKHPSALAVIDQIASRTDCPNLLGVSDEVGAYCWSQGIAGKNQISVITGLSNCPECFSGEGSQNGSLDISIFIKDIGLLTVTSYDRNAMWIESTRMQLQSLFSGQIVHYYQNYVMNQ
jgi:hypothetical protein